MPQRDLRSPEKSLRSKVLKQKVSIKHDSFSYKVRLVPREHGKHVGFRSAVGDAKAHFGIVVARQGVYYVGRRSGVFDNRLAHAIITVAEAALTRALSLAPEHALAHMPYQPRGSRHGPSHRAVPRVDGHLD